MKKLLLTGIVTLIVSGCSITVPQHIEVEHKTEVKVDPATLDGVNKIAGNVMDKLQQMQTQAFDAVRKAEEERRHLCWQEGGRNCSGGSYAPSRLGGIYR
jgi:hypothetical protein